MGMAGIMIALGKPKDPQQDNAPPSMAPRASLRASGGGGARPAPFPDLFAGGAGAPEEASETGTFTCPNCQCKYDLVKKEDPMPGMPGSHGMPPDPGTPPMPGGGV